MDLIARASEIPTRERAKVIMATATKESGSPAPPPPKRRNSAPSDAAELRKLGLDKVSKPERGRSRIKELLQTGVGDMVDLEYKPVEKPEDKKKKMMLVKAIIEKRASKKAPGTAPSKKYKPIDRPKAMGSPAAWHAVHADEAPPPRPSKKKAAEPRRDPESIKALMSTDAGDARDAAPPPAKRKDSDGEGKKKKKKHKDSFLDSELEFTYQENDMTFGAPGVKELPQEMFRPETLSIAIAKGKMEANPDTPKRKKKDSSPPPPPPPIADLLAIEAEEKAKELRAKEKKKEEAKKRAAVRKMLKTRNSDPGALPSSVGSGGSDSEAPKLPEEDYIDFSPGGSPAAVVVLDGMEESVNWAHDKDSAKKKAPPSKPMPTPPTKKRYVDDDEDEVESVDDDVDLGSDEDGADFDDDGDEVPDAEMKKHEVYVMDPDDYPTSSKSAPGTRASHYYYEVELVNKAKSAPGPKSPRVAIVKDDVDEDIDEPDCEPPDEDL